MEGLTTLIAFIVYYSFLHRGQRKINKFADKHPLISFD